MSTVLLSLLSLCFILPITLGRIGARYGGHGGSHSYPRSSGLSGSTYSRTPQTHSYPSNTGLSGNTGRSHPSHDYTRATSHGHAAGGYHSVHKTEVHHYHYSPPQQIHYGSSYHPVYHGTPPTYVYEYRQSGSRYDNLLTGLALYNLGRMSANNDHYHSYRSDYGGNGGYRTNPGEICKLAISKSNGEYEETKINCQLISSFIWDFEQEQKAATNTIQKTVVTQSVISNGTSTITVQNTTVVDALQVKGTSVAVTPGMRCFMIRISVGYSTLKKKIDCGLLQEYATKSLYSHSFRFQPVTFVFIFILVNFLQ